MIKWQKSSLVIHLKFRYYPYCLIGHLERRRYSISLGLCPNSSLPTASTATASKPACRPNQIQRSWNTALIIDKLDFCNFTHIENSNASCVMRIAESIRNTIYAIRTTKLNGAGGIRTPGTFRYNGFQDRRLQPLGHCSGFGLFYCLIYNRVGHPILSKFSTILCGKADFARKFGGIDEPTGS